MQETQDNDEISLKELIGKVQELGHTLRTEVWGKHKLVIVLVTLLTGFGFGFKAYTTKPTYTADLTFILKESAGGGGLNALMGQLSFLGGMGTSNNTDKVQNFQDLIENATEMSAFTIENATTENLPIYYLN